MRIMCLNGWGGKLHSQLLPYLEASQPDILCLQEVVHTPIAPKPWLSYRDQDFELPQRSQFFDEVCAALPNYVAIFCPAAQGVLYDGDTSYPSQWGLATFVHKSIPIIGQTQGFVHKEYSQDGYGDHPRSRNAHAVRLFDYDSNTPITIVHLHGLRDLAGKHDTPARAVQAQRLATLIRNTAQSGDKLVVCGDFNLLPNSVTFAKLQELGLHDLVTTRGFTSTRTPSYTKPNKFADYMFVNEALKDAAFEVINDPEVSDHCPLVLEFS